MYRGFIARGFLDNLTNLVQYIPEAMGKRLLKRKQNLAKSFYNALYLLPFFLATPSTHSVLKENSDSVDNLVKSSFNS